MLRLALPELSDIYSYTIQASKWHQISGRQGKEDDKTLGSVVGGGDAHARPQGYVRLPLRSALSSDSEGSCNLTPTCQKLVAFWSVYSEVES